MWLEHEEEILEAIEELYGMCGEVEIIDILKIPYHEDLKDEKLKEYKEVLLSEIQVEIQNLKQ
jgi:hypothetical protein